MKEVNKAVADYLDSMPPFSRVTIPDLITVVMARVDGVTKGYRLKYVRDIIRSVVHAHPEFMLMRQKGICKWSKQP